MTIALGIPADVVNAIQTNVLERVWHDALFPAMQFRGEAAAEVWPVNLGETQVFSRPSLLAPITTPRAAGVDPPPQTMALEQWEVTADAFNGAIDTHMPTSTVTLASLFLRHAQQLGLQAGQSLNRLVRNALYRAYLGGHTVSFGADAGVNLAHLAAGNGFRTVLVNGRPVAISVANPLPIIIGAATARNATGFVPDDATDPDGPGILTYDGADVATPDRTVFRTVNRPFLIRTGGGDSIDAIGAADTLVMQNIIDAINRLRQMNVRPMADGAYHVHVTPTGFGQLYTDAAWRTVFTALPDHIAYKENVVQYLHGAVWYQNSETPTDLNVGALTATSGAAFYGRDVGAEVRNNAGLAIHRAIVVGQAACYEKYIDESKFVTEAGVTGKIGEFSIVNNGLAIMTERIRYVIRSPQDRLQELVSQAWSWKGGFAVPSDALSGDAARFKRAVVIEHVGA